MKDPWADVRKLLNDQIVGAGIAYVHVEKLLTDADALLALAIVFYQLGEDEPLIAQWAWREWEKLSPKLQDAIAKAPMPEHLKEE